MNERVWQSGDDLVGDKLKITQAVIDRYAEVSGDHNPIHVDADFARATPYGGRIAHGMLGAALINKLIVQNLKPQHFENINLNFKFKAPIKADSTVRVVGTIRDNANHNLQIEAKCLLEDDTVAIACDATVKNWNDSAGK